MEFMQEYMRELSALATVLQLIGTLVLALFSFFGIDISENKDAYLEGIQKVEIKPAWLRRARWALAILVIGIVLSGWVSWVSFSAPSQ